MSLDGKRDRLTKVTKMFDKFVDHMSEVRSNINLQSTYSEGYAACLSDILDALKEGGKESEITKIIKSKVSMEARASVLDELSESLVKLKDAYNDILKEE